MTTKDNCLQFRREGYSYRSISKMCKVPLSTVFLWTKDIVLTKIQVNRNKQVSLDRLQASRKRAQSIKKEKYVRRNEVNHNMGKSMVHKIDKQNINELIAALYWGEGFKKDRRLGLANSDPEIIRLFIYWLVRVARVPVDQIRLRVGVNAMFKDRVDRINRYWSSTTNIPLEQFQKPFFQNTKITRVYPNIENYYGVLRVRANGQNDTFQKLLGMVERLKKETMGLDFSDID